MSCALLFVSMELLVCILLNIFFKFSTIPQKSRILSIASHRPEANGYAERLLLDFRWGGSQGERERKRARERPDASGDSGEPEASRGAGAGD